MIAVRLTIMTLFLIMTLYTIYVILITQTTREGLFSSMKHSLYTITKPSIKTTGDLPDTMATLTVRKNGDSQSPNMSNDTNANSFASIQTPSRDRDTCRGSNDSLPACHKRKVISDKTFNVSLEVFSFDELVSRHGDDLSKGGHFRPETCKADQKVAIVIPYRDRETNLKRFLNNIHPFLKKQDVEYTLFVVEQLSGSPFNRGMIINIGFVEASKICKFDCLIIHDNDLAPDDNGNLYRCGQQPRQHARDLPRWNHKPPYGNSFGGVVSIRREQFIKTNGFSNTYFVWGREDDEFGKRVEYHNFTRDTMPFQVASYREFDHTKVKKYTKSFDWFPNWKSRVKNDGLTTLHYELRGIVRSPLYTHIFADINVDTVRKAYHGKIVAADSHDVAIHERH